MEKIEVKMMVWLKDLIEFIHKNSERIKIEGANCFTNL